MSMDKNHLQKNSSPRTGTVFCLCFVLFLEQIKLVLLSSVRSSLLGPQQAHKHFFFVFYQDFNQFEPVYLQILTHMITHTTPRNFLMNKSILTIKREILCSRNMEKNYFGLYTGVPPEYFHAASHCKNFMPS